MDRYVKTTIITDSLGEAVESSGAGFATLEDVGQALLRVVSDSSIHGKALRDSGMRADMWYQVEQSPLRHELGKVLQTDTLIWKKTITTRTNNLGCIRCKVMS